MTQEQKIVKLIDLVKLTPEIKWDYHLLSFNPNIYLEDIPIKNRDIEPFDKKSLSNNPNLTFDWLYNNFFAEKGNFITKLFHNKKKEYKKWDWNILSQKMPLENILSHPELSWDCRKVSERITNIDIVLENPDFDWSWDILLENLPVDQIMSHLDLPWNYNFITYNKTLTIEFIQDHKKFNWRWDILSEILHITEIEAHPEYSWSFHSLSKNKTLTSEFVLSNIRKSWDWPRIFANSNINYDTFAEAKIDLSAQISSVMQFENSTISETKNLTSKFVRKYKNIFLQNYYSFISIHRNGILTLQDIQQDPDLIVDYQYLSSNPNLTIDYLINDKDKLCFLYKLSLNNSFKMKDILKGFENGINWDFEGLSDNWNITFDFVYANKNKSWNGLMLSSNKFVKQN